MTQASGVTQERAKRGVTAAPANVLWPNGPTGSVAPALLENASHNRLRIIFPRPETLAAGRATLPGSSHVGEVILDEMMSQVLLRVSESILEKGEPMFRTALTKVAVRVGFEPTEAVRPQRFSRPPDSTTLAPHRGLTSVIVAERLRVPPVAGQTPLQFLARPEGLEPPAYWFEASRSIRLSYGRANIHSRP